MANLIQIVVTWATNIISNFGYGGLFLTMALESAAIPIPSEVVVPFSGFLASKGQLNFWVVVIVATIANLSGAIVIYYIGFFGGEPFLEKYGRYFLIHRDDISKLDSWLSRHGAKLAFLSRLLPGIRTFSSIVIGVGKVNLSKFIWYTLAGSFVWNFALAYIGFTAGNKWDLLRPYFRKFDMLILTVIIIGIILFIFKHIHKFKKLSKHPKL